MQALGQIQLADAIANKDEAALGQLLDQYGALINSIINKHLQRLQGYREECFNDVLLAIWRNIGQYDSARSSLKNWVAGIARYQALNYVRKYIHELQNQDIDAAATLSDAKSEQQLLQTEHDEQFELLIDGLGAQDKELFRRLYLHNQELSQISADMRLSTDVLYNRLSRARKKIRTFLGKKGE